MAEANEKKEVKEEAEEAKEEVKGKGTMDEKQERMWGMLCHIGAFAGFFVPFGNVIAPLVIWLTKKEDSAFIEDQGRESLNFQISMTIYFIVAFVLSFVVIGFIVMPALAIFQIVMLIMAGMKANNGEKFRYPMAIKFVK